MMAKSHSADHEASILAAAFDDPPDDWAELVEQLVQCEECVSYVFRTIDDVSALHTIARSRSAMAKPPELRCIERLDALLDDVMVLLAHHPGSGGPSQPGGAGEKAETSGKRSVPVGKD